MNNKVEKESSDPIAFPNLREKADLRLICKMCGRLIDLRCVNEYKVDNPETKSLDRVCGPCFMLIRINDSLQEISAKLGSPIPRFDSHGRN